jgi:hypothetical protein
MTDITKCLSENSLNVEKKMKVGDIVEVHDGSYSLFYGGSGVPVHVDGANLKWRRFRVLLAGVVLPFDSTYLVNPASCHARRMQNNLMLCEVEAPEQILFTQARFCNVVFTRPIDAPPSSHVEVVIPFGIKSVAIRMLDEHK